MKNFFILFIFLISGIDILQAQSCVLITQPDDLTINCSKIDVTTSGGSNGTASVTASGGTAPYSYLWSNNATTDNINNLLSGTYSVTATDSKGCTTECSTTINEPGCTLSATIEGTNVTCNGGNDGETSVTVSGNIGGVAYKWSNGATISAITGLIAGTYTVTVTESATCKTTATYTVTEPSILVLICSKTNATINGGNNGNASASVSGGTSPYNYLWNNGATDASISNLLSATYSVIVSDANGCTKACSATVGEPNCALSITTSGTSVKCNGGNDGSASVTVSGNNGTVAFLWSNGKTTASIVGLIAGSYAVTVTESATCVAKDGYLVVEPTLLSLTCSKTDVSTSGGSNGEASVVASGGTPPYAYLWSNNETTSSITDLLSGTYSVTVTDANNCTKICSSNVAEPGCTAPTIGTNTPTAGTCAAAVPNNDAKIDFAGFFNANKAELWEGATYAGLAYNVATSSVASGAVSFTGLKHNTVYTFRFWNGVNTCLIDVTITTPTKTCATPCGLPTCGGGTSVRKL